MERAARDWQAWRATAATWLRGGVERLLGPTRPSSESAPPAASAPARAPGDYPTVPRIAAWPRQDRGWRYIVDALVDAAVALDRLGNVAHFNQPAADLFPKVRVGQPFSHASRAPELLTAIEQAITGQGSSTVELQDWVPVERRIAAHVRSLPADDFAGMAACLVVFRDLSYQDRLTQMRSDFIANASHELRTPLASLRGFVETLQGPARQDPRARDRFLDIMAKEAARMTRLIDDLLSLSRIEMRVHLPPKDTVELADVAGFVAQTLEPVAANAGTRLVVERMADPAFVRGEREELVQVLQNLVQNAIKYGRTGGTVRVEMRQESEGTSRRYALAVEDDGPGIAPEHLPRLTERFYRVSAAVSRDKGGTGLGLAIVKHIVNRHRGELRIESELGRGSTFTVVLDALETRAGTSRQFSAP